MHLLLGTSEYLYFIARGQHNFPTDQPGEALQQQTVESLNCRSDECKWHLGILTPRKSHGMYHHVSEKHILKH